QGQSAGGRSPLVDRSSVGRGTMASATQRVAPRATGPWGPPAAPVGKGRDEMTRINVRRGIAALALALGLLLASKPAGAATGTLDIWRWLSGFLPMSTLAGADGVDSRPALSKAGATWGAQHTVTANEGGCIEPN